MLDEILDRQRRVLTRVQALSCGMSAGAIRARVDSGRWRPLYRSTYASFSGPVPHDSLLWAAVLCAGADAVLSHESAAELIGLIDRSPDRIHVSVPSGRKVRPCPGMVVHRSSRVDVGRHPTRLPPQTRVEETVVDLTRSSTSLDRALGLMAKACGRRLTRPERLVAAIDARKKLRWRGELLAGLDDIADGAHSVLEARYLRDVERAHRLPRGSRQHMAHRPGGRYYDDVRYAAFGVVVELDGRVAHPDEARWRDMRRDNACVAEGRRVLRYGWADVATDPCAVASQVAMVLRMAGWRDAPRPCRAGCPLHAALHDHGKFARL